MTALRNEVSAEGTAREFAARYGYSATGVWSAPGRVNLIGEHTDYNEGFVLPFAINRRTYAAVALRKDGICRVSSSFTDESVQVRFDGISRDSVAGWSAYPLGVAWALGAKSGFDIYIDSDVPVGAGLSSSAAIECAVSVALNELWSTGFDRRELARIGQRAENEIVGAPTGIMDQSASLLGELDHAVFLDCRTLETQAEALGFAAAELELVIIDTKVEHRHADGGYKSRREACERGAASLGVSSLRDLGVDDLPRAAEVLDELTYRRVKHVITENQRVLETVKTLREQG
ncbi:MAG: galactokinase, partial [Phenylobacterium zucineum]